jgi:hypothetical protein
LFRHWKLRGNNAATGTLALAAALLAFAASLSAAVECFAACFAGNALWKLARADAPRARLQCGLSLPLLQILSPATMLVAWGLVLAFVIIALRESGWLKRTASLMTLVFPSLLLLACRAYLLWLGYPWPPHVLSL